MKVGRSGLVGHSQPCSVPQALPGVHSQPGQYLAEEHPSLHPPTQPRELRTPLWALVEIVSLKSVRFLPWTSVRALGV